MKRFLRLERKRPACNERKYFLREKAVINKVVRYQQQFSHPKRKLNATGTDCAPVEEKNNYAD